MEPKPIPPETLERRARFDARVRKEPTGCWLWIGQKVTKYGYGRYAGFRAHRVAYAWAYGDTTRDLHHICGNHACVNPEHLEPAEGQYRHRGPKPHTHCKRGHEFTLENTYLDGGGARQCRACLRLKAAEFRKAHREQILVRRRELRKHVIHEPGPCERCGIEFQPIRSTARLCERCRNDKTEYQRNYMRAYRAKKRGG